MVGALAAVLFIVAAIMAVTQEHGTARLLALAGLSASVIAIGLAAVIEVRFQDCRSWNEAYVKSHPSARFVGIGEDTPLRSCRRWL
jgi:hypothetical protein